MLQIAPQSRAEALFGRLRLAQLYPRGLSISSGGRGGVGKPAKHRARGGDPLLRRLGMLLSLSLHVHDLFAYIILLKTIEIQAKTNHNN